jgi:hypothetical protein
MDLFTRDGKERIEVFGTDQYGRGYVFTFLFGALMTIRYDAEGRN